MSLKDELDSAGKNPLNQNPLSTNQTNQNSHFPGNHNLPTDRIPPVNHNELPPVTKKVDKFSTKAVYTGDFRVLGSNAAPIPKEGDVYKPENEDHVAMLEYQVTQGRVTKS
jgi:hypothetical protein